MLDAPSKGSIERRQIDVSRTKAIYLESRPRGDHRSGHVWAATVGNSLGPLELSAAVI
jgi:hypothetical protein